MHPLEVFILLTVYRAQLFKQMTQISHSRDYLWKNNPVYRELCVFVGVCLCLCLSSNNETWKYCDRCGTDRVISFEVIGSSSGMNKTA